MAETCAAVFLVTVTATPALAGSGVVPRLLKTTAEFLSALRIFNSIEFCDIDFASLELLKLNGTEGRQAAASLTLPRRNTAFPVFWKSKRPGTLIHPTQPHNECAVTMENGMSQRGFSELQNALENVVIELRVAHDPHDRRTLLHQILQLIVEADTILREQPLTKYAR